jgi:hypothetical protein
LRRSTEPETRSAVLSHATLRARGPNSFSPGASEAAARHRSREARRGLLEGALAGPSTLRDYEVPREDLPELAQAIAERPPAKANHAPRRQR